MKLERLQMPWSCSDPFLFCVHHDDRYPAGNPALGPDAPLEGRDLGQDFEGKDGWRMYHGLEVPGFPHHPHRGFETVTIVRRGLVDHADSLGAAARYGEGDVQWLTAGRGILHSEMFPLMRSDRDNPLELFQIWLNLPRAQKMATPHFSMFWNGDIPRLREGGVEATIIAGELHGVRPLSPPPESWASRPESDLAIWTLKLSPRASFELPAPRPGSNRSLYVFKGDRLRVNGEEIASGHRAIVTGATALQNGEAESELLVLQGAPLGEPVVQYGPFVMNSQEEIAQTIRDYQRTRFGGWPWPSEAPVHPRNKGRFARHADGHVDRPAER